MCFKKLCSGVEWVDFRRGGGILQKRPSPCLILDLQRLESLNLR